MEKLVAMAWIAALGLSVGCTPGSKEIGETVDDDDTSAMDTGSTESGGNDTGTDTSGNDTGVTSNADTVGDTTTTDSTTSMPDTDGGPMSCSDLSDEESCLSTRFGEESCGWYEISTWALDNEGACGEVNGPTTGYCLARTQADGCGVGGDPSCPDGETIVYYLSVGLEIGAVELFVLPETELCETPGEFLECTFDGVDYDPPECACACPGA